MMKKYLTYSAILIAALTGVVLMPQEAKAVTAADWMPGRIADDGLFFNPYTMSTQDIQTFLNAKVPTCDTWHSGSGSNQPPFTCLKDYSQTISSKSPDAYCSGSITAGTKTAAQIINDVAKACTVNPQTLIVLLQKEQSLVTDTWPWNVQYQKATGYGCPDTSACDSAYYGFFNQVYNAARQFQRYGKESWRYNFRVGTTSNVQWHPDFPVYDSNGNFVRWEDRCGGMNVYMQTKATAALYNYTPYQPNGDALTNMYGEGNTCSAYGNRNFWRIFHDWFGSPYRINGTVNLSQGLSLSSTSSTKYIGDTITASYEVENTATYDVYVGGLGVCGRVNGQNYDFGFIHHNSIAAGGKKTITFSKKLDTAGTLNVFLCSYYEGVGGWVSDRYPYDSAAPMIRQATINVADNPFITSDLILGPANPGIHQSVTAYTSIKNASEIDINIGSLVIAARDPLGRNVDFPIKNDVIISANSTVNLTWTRTFTMPGNYSFHIANWNGVWRTDYPKSANNFVIRQLNWPILDNPLISSGITVTTPTPTAGQPVDVTLTFRNTSGSDINIGSVVIAARNSTGGNVDFPLKNDVIIPANNTKTFTWTRTFSSPGTYSLFVANWNGAWTTSYPKSMNESVQRQTTINVN